MEEKIYVYRSIRGYKADNSKLGRSVELDGLASGMGEAKNRLLVAECKYRSKALSLAVLEHLRESLTIFPAEHYDIYLFSKSGFADDILALEDPEVHLIDLEKMAGDIPEMTLKLAPESKGLKAMKTASRIAKESGISEMSPDEINYEISQARNKEDA